MDARGNPCPARDNHALSQIGKLCAYIHDFVAKELRFINAHNFRARQKLFHDFLGSRNIVGRDAQA